MSTLILIFLSGGAAVLEEDGEQTWASDDDEDFETEIGNAPLDVEDETTVLDYLIEHDIIDEEERARITTEVEDAAEDDGDAVIDADFEIVDPPVHSN
jgi:tRNA G46 methylase TrmB